MKTSCIACLNPLTKLGNKNNFTIWVCNSCGLGVTEGIVDQDYTQYHRDSTYIKESKQFENIFERRVKTISKFKNPGKALEVGSSTGLLLHLLKKRGWDVLGVEPSEDAAKYALNRGVPTEVKTFEKFNSKEKYDVVILNHILEHVDEPIKFLQKSYSLLEKDGIIFIDVPHFGSFTAKRKKENWEYLLPEEHKWHYTKKSLQILLEKSKFELIFSQTNSGIWDYGHPAKELIQSLLGLKKRFLRSSLTALPSYIITKLGLGTGLTVIGKKK